MSTPEVPNVDPALSSSGFTSTTLTPAAPGSKRRREMYIEKPGVDCERKTENVTELEGTLWQEQSETSHIPLQSICCESEEEQSEELNPPQCKRRCTDTSTLPDDSQLPPQAWSQDPQFSHSQYSESELTGQKNTTVTNLNDSEPSFLNGLSEGAFGFEMDLKGKTSTQKSFTGYHSCQMEDDKENSRIVYSRSPCAHTSLVRTKPHLDCKWVESKTASLRKHTTNKLCKKVDRDENSAPQFKWTKPSSSPLKKQAPPQQQTREDDEDSLALFTQDSVGFRVIAHRDPQIQSPLRDQSNVSTGVVKATAYKYLTEDEEDMMLFTQDSQGNMVIKH
uniref:Uncharacterized protein n=2 Tax=Echeneis naucrates TaxID=173247 RepID=A0A665TZM7_ECHNA